jgi:hypothetical protein
MRGRSAWIHVQRLRPANECKTVMHNCMAIYSRRGRTTTGTNPIKHFTAVIYGFLK